MLHSENRITLTGKSLLMEITHYALLVEKPTLLSIFENFRKSNSLHPKKLELTMSAEKLQCECVQESPAQNRSSDIRSGADFGYMPRLGDENLLQKTLDSIDFHCFRINREDLDIGKKLGEGAFGIVAKGKLRGARCAVKMLRDDASQSSMDVGYKCLLAEISVLSEIGAHPNLVAFYGACLQDATPLIVQEYIEGQNLQEYLDTKKFGFNLGKAKVAKIRKHFKITKTE